MKILLLTSMIMLIALISNAQHEHQHHPAVDTTAAKKPAVKKNSQAQKSVAKKPVPVAKQDSALEMKPMQMDHGDHGGHDMSSMPSHAFSRSLPMNRNASGTSWNPDASPMYMWIKQTAKTDWMFHGNIFLRYTNTDVFESGGRGGEKFSFPNWFMAMMNRKVGKKGLVNATAMLSLDRLTEGGAGYPLLFQSGETWQGERLVDRQHPHDLFSALSIGYTQMLNKDVDLFGYFGYPGEPALGSPAFMHRVSAMNDPDAPLGHHWQDATHITFGVGTFGVRYSNFKLEGSIFTGREPDENRYNFDKPRFDSYSYRVSYNPTKKWAIQFSQGFIEEPEELEPDVDVTRTTASILYSSAVAADRHVSAALIWGLNNKGENHKEHSVLAESNFQFGRNALFGRYEFIQKAAEELDLEDVLGHSTFNIHALSLGYNRILFSKIGIDLLAGAKATMDFPAAGLKSIYGNQPVGLQVYLQLRPSLHFHR